MIPTACYIDAMTRGQLAHGDPFDDVIAEAMLRVREAYQPAIDARKAGTDPGLPDLPGPADGYAQYIPAEQATRIALAEDPYGDGEGYLPPMLPADVDAIDDPAAAELYPRVLLTAGGGDANA